MRVTFLWNVYRVVENNDIGVGLNSQRPGFYNGTVFYRSVCIIEPGWHVRVVRDVSGTISLNHEIVVFVRLPGNVVFRVRVEWNWALSVGVINAFVIETVFSNFVVVGYCGVDIKYVNYKDMSNKPLPFPEDSVKLGCSTTRPTCGCDLVQTITSYHQTGFSLSNVLQR